MFRGCLKIAWLQALGQPIEVEINDRSGKQRKHLRENQSADNADAERLAEFGAHTTAECERKSSEKCRECGHKDGPKAQQTCLKNSFLGRFSFFALGLER